MSLSPQPPARDPSAMDGRRDFDFLIGQWTVAHCRLQERLADCRDWDRFSGTCEMRPIIGGLANMDDNTLAFPAGPYNAATLRIFDPETKRWSIWWIDGRHPVVERPVHGRFSDGIGTFYGDHVLDGRPVRIRFLWSAITARSATWEQAFSVDEGATWEDNWVMLFTRSPNP